MTISTKRVRTSSGLYLAVDFMGEPGGGTVILLHGGGQTRHSWHGAAHELAAQGYYVMCYDARGHGDSDWAPDGDYSIESLAHDLTDVIVEVGLERPLALVGASMGGMTSFYAVGAANHPIADALILVDITLTPAVSGVKKIIAFMQAHADGFPSLEEAANAIAAYNPGRSRPANPEGLRKNLRERDNRFFWHWDPRFMDQSKTSEPPSFKEALIAVSGNVRLPTLLVRGEKSDVVDDEGVAELLRMVPQTEVSIVAAAGHMVAGDRNDAFNKAILGFLKSQMSM